MPLIRLFDHKSSPTDDVINDVEMDFPPMVGDILEFETRGVDAVKYKVMSRIHKFGPQENPGTAMLGIAVREIKPAKPVTITSTVRGTY